MTSETFWFDIFSAFVLFTTALFGAYLPRYFVTRRGNAELRARMSRYFHMGNCLSAGVMLSAAFCHLLSDAQKELLFLGSFPITNFLAAVGFILTLAADQLVHFITSKAQNGCPVSPPHSFPIPHSAVDPEGSGSGSKLVAFPAPVDSAVIRTVRPPPHSLPLPPLHSAHSAHSDHPSSSSACHGLSIFVDPKSPKLPFHTTLLLACALCVHSVLEGSAMGAQKTLTGTEDVMMAIAAHKGLAAYALGASIVESQASSKRFWVVVGLFSVASPVGIVVGMALAQTAGGYGGAVMSALAAGTFLYVATMEVLPKELRGSGGGGEGGGGGGRGEEEGGDEEEGQEEEEQEEGDVEKQGLLGRANDASRRRVSNESYLADSDGSHSFLHALHHSSNQNSNHRKDHKPLEDHGIGLMSHDCAEVIIHEDEEGSDEIDSADEGLIQGNKKSRSKSKFLKNNNNASGHEINHSLGTAINHSNNYGVDNYEAGQGIDVKASQGHGVLDLEGKPGKAAAVGRSDRLSGEVRNLRGMGIGKDVGRARSFATGGKRTAVSMGMTSRTEYKSDITPPFKLLAFSIGFGLMSLLAIWA